MELEIAYHRVDPTDRFLFAVSPDFPLALLPPDEGLIVADRFEAALLREGRLRPIAAASPGVCERDRQA